MTEAYICAALRTPVGKHGGSLASVRADDLAAIPIKAVVERSGIDPLAIDDVILGCTNQAGEDNRNVARMALLLAGLPVEVPGQTDAPPYFTLQASRPDQVSESISVIVSRDRLPDVTPGAAPLLRRRLGTRSRHDRRARRRRSWADTQAAICGCPVSTNLPRAAQTWQVGRHGCE